MSETKTELEARVAELEEKLRNSEQRLTAVEQAARTAEANELTLHRRLSPYLDAEIQDRDAEIERLKQSHALSAEIEGRDGS